MGATDISSPAIHTSRHFNSERIKVVVASSLGTIIEWYEFFLYAYLSQIIAVKFFSGVNETLGFLFALITFAIGFLVRPIGGLVFGRLGDTVGRKRTFLITLVLMGLSTVAVGLLPTHAQVGLAAPIMLVMLRVIQGLAIGGEYGGALVYVAEHAPRKRRGLFTGFIQITVPIGLLMSVGVISLTQGGLGDAAFNDWGWRIPFLLAGPFLILAIWVRTKMEESPVFLQMKSEGTESRSPLKEAFATRANLRISVIALLGGVAGQAVVWQTATLYVMFFMNKTLGVESSTTNNLMILLMVSGVVFLLFFAWISDIIGRNPVIIAGCVAAALLYFPIFNSLAISANPALVLAHENSPVTLMAGKADCASGLPFLNSGNRDGLCNVAKNTLNGRGVAFRMIEAEDGSAHVQIGDRTVPFPDAAPEDEVARAQFAKEIQDHLNAENYPAKADMTKANMPQIIFLLMVIVALGAMTLGPLGAQLVEIFPTKIRYSGLSLPFNIGNGWFGGLLPTITFMITQHTGDIYAGLWYPIIIASGTALIALFFMPETRGSEIN